MVLNEKVDGLISHNFAKWQNEAYPASGINYKGSKAERV
jgi:hypothetical protein